MSEAEKLVTAGHELQEKDYRFQIVSELLAEAE